MSDDSVSLPLSDLPTPALDVLLSCLDWRSQRRCERVCRRWHEMLRSRPCCTSIEPNDEAWTLEIRTGLVGLSLRSWLAPQRQENPIDVNFDQTTCTANIQITNGADPSAVLLLIKRMFCQLPLSKYHIDFLLWRTPGHKLCEIMTGHLAVGVQHHLRYLKSYSIGFGSRNMPPITDVFLVSMPNLRCLSIDEFHVQITFLPANISELYLRECDFTGGETSTQLLTNWIGAATHIEQIRVYLDENAENTVTEKIIQNPRHLRTVRLLDASTSAVTHCSVKEPGTLKQLYERLILRALDVRATNEGAPMSEEFKLQLDTDNESFPLAEFRERFDSFIRNIQVVRDDEWVDVATVENEENFDLEHEEGIRVHFDYGVVVEFY